MLVDKKQIKLTIGGEVVIQTGDGYPWVLRHISNDTFLTPSSPVTQFAGRDGGTFKKRRFIERAPTIYVDPFDRSKSRINSDWLYLKAVLNGKLDAELELTAYGVSRCLYGSITDLKKRDEDGMRWDSPADFRFVFTAPDPYYIGPEKEVLFSYELPLISFPLTFWYDGGMTAGLSVSGDSATFMVEGQDPAIYVVTAEATGTVVNPKITTANGGLVQADLTMQDGDVLVLTQNADAAILRLNGAWCPRTLTSKFFPLRIGLNTITISADSGAENLIRQMKYRERYQ